MDIDKRNLSIVERLEELRDLMKQDIDRAVLQDAMDEIEKLREERSRLREALNLIRIAIENYGNGGKSEGFALGYVDEVARAALKGDE